MKLNLGCGREAMPGYINVDARPDCGDFVADVRSLPWPDDSVEEIQAIDLLEHFPATETQKVLAEWHRVLSDGSLLVLRVPNLLELSKLLSADDERARAYIRNIYGGHRWGDLDTHHTGWTPRLLHEELEKSNFQVIDNDGGANMKVRALAV